MYSYSACLTRLLTFLHRDPVWVLILHFRDAWSWTSDSNLRKSKVSNHEILLNERLGLRGVVKGIDNNLIVGTPQHNPGSCREGSWPATSHGEPS